MPDWPSQDQTAVYVPLSSPAPAPSGIEARALIASARVREGLPVSDEILSRILEQQSDTGYAGLQMFTAGEQDDIYGDNDRVAQARAVLADADDVLGGLQLCWRDGRRCVRVLLTGEQERYRRLLSKAVGRKRVVIDSAPFTERELADRADQVGQHREELATHGIFLTGHGTGVDGLEIGYLAADPAAAQWLLRARFGEFAVLRYQGASNHTLRPFPFGSWLAEEDRLHVFYGLPHNGERPGGCQAFETDTAVIVSLTILDWRGPKTAVGGFIPSHATVQLRDQLGDRAVIDNAENRSRPHWTHA